MTTNTNFDTLTLVDKGIVLSFKNEPKKEISFSELDIIYMKEYKLKPVYEFVLILLPFLLILLSIQYLTLEKVLLLSLFTVIPIFIKTHYYKRYGMQISVKDGSLFRKRIPLDLKTETVNLINAVKRERLNYVVKTKELCGLESHNFNHNMAS